MIETSAPGKLMLSGEWSVLELGVPCVVMAIDDRVNCKIQENDKIVLNAPDIGLTGIEGIFENGKMQWKTELDEKQKDKIKVTQNVIETTLNYAKEKGIETRNFSIDTSSKISSVTLDNGEIAKVGFGSSAAAAVAITVGILKLHGIEADKDTIYKLACIAHYFAQGKVGSAFDVAASTYGQVLVYSRFDGKWLVEEIEKGKKISEIVEEDWKSFTAEPLPLPQDFHLCVGFVGYSASTKELVVKLHKEFKAQQKDRYMEIINEIKTCTSNLITSMKEKNSGKIIEFLKQNRNLLQTLSKESGANLETKELALLADIADKYENSVGKFSGAGGGDCGIAICFSDISAEKIKSEWKENGLYPLDVSIAKKGVTN